MPIYEYRCKHCGEVFELLRRSGDSDEDIRCEKCGRPEVERLFSAFATGSSSYTSSGSSCSSSGGFT